MYDGLHSDREFHTKAAHYDPKYEWSQIAKRDRANPLYPAGCVLFYNSDTKHRNLNISQAQVPRIAGRSTRAENSPYYFASRIWISGLWQGVYDDRRWLIHLLPVLHA